MKILRWFTIPVFLMLSIAVCAQTSTVFSLVPIPLANGWRVTVRL